MYTCHIQRQNRLNRRGLQAQHGQAQHGWMMEKCKACVQKDATWKNAKLVWRRRSVVNGAEPILENPSIDICFWEHSDLWGVIVSRIFPRDKGCMQAAHGTPQHACESTTD